MIKEIGQTSLVLLAFLVIGILIVQIINYRGVKKQKKRFEELHKSLKPGVTVMLTGGIYGKITRVNKDYVMLEVAKDVEIKVSRYSISEIIK